MADYARIDTLNDVRTSGSQIEIFENDGGQFVHRSLIDLGKNGGAPLLDVLDIDGDNDLDILVRFLSSPNILENLGDMEFGRRTPLLTNESEIQTFRNIEFADFNGDGAPDLLGVSAHENQLTIQLNERDSERAVISPAEIDLLYAAINTGSTDDEDDLNQDGAVNAADVDYLVEEVAGSIRGDTDLDGDVDFQDFLNASNAFGQEEAGWAGGDFDGNGTVEFADLLLVFSNFGFDRDNV